MNQRPGFVVGFNPVPMANEVATLGMRLRHRVLALLLAAGVWTGLWLWQRDRWGSPWLLAAGYLVSIVLITVMALRLGAARRHLARIGSGPAVEAGRQGLVLHGLDGQQHEVAWDQVRAIRTGGLKLGAGPQLVVESGADQRWQVPLSFLDARPGTIDAGLRAASSGRHGLDLSGLDHII